VELDGGQHALQRRSDKTRTAYLEAQGYWPDFRLKFLNYLQDVGADTVSVKVALDWARLPVGGDTNWWAYRLSVVRGFATYLHALDPAHEVPAAELLPQRPHRASPYLYSDADIAALIAATSALRTPLRQATFATLIGLLAVTGIFSRDP
jgi:site-specific recombinase XerD